jgi:hypothetical protein
MPQENSHHTMARLIRTIYRSTEEQSIQDDEPKGVLPCAYHITDAFCASDLAKLETLRQKIPLDVSRPTCPRRFLTEKKDTNGQHEQHQEDGWVGALIDSAVASWKLPLHSLPWYRYLEYTEPGGHMDKHTDGSNLHPTTGARSVATMLLYLSTCSEGGETTLYRKVKKGKQQQQQQQQQQNNGIVESIRPVYNTVLIFPHGWQHSGDPVIIDPKIALRVDLAWKDRQDEREQSDT